MLSFFFFFRRKLNTHTHNCEVSGFSSTMPPSSTQACSVEEIVGDFKWGNKRGIGVKNKDTQFYDSFVYEGVEYFLHDCVYFYHTDHVETSIGMLVKMFENSRRKMIRVVWFFRPSEIRSFHRGYQPSWNELFLASGKGKGLTNVNSVVMVILIRTDTSDRIHHVLVSDTASH